MQKPTVVVQGLGALTLGIAGSFGVGLRGPATVIATPSADTLANAVISNVCSRCHNDDRMRGNLTLAAFDAEVAHEQAELAERMIRKLRAGMMPPPGTRRPDEATLLAVVEELENRIDAHALADPDPGGRTFQRLNRAEYEASVRTILDLEVDASAYLPNETVSAGFDNIADVQTLSATLLDGYLRAAGEISRLALGDPSATSREAEYEVSRYSEQRRHVEGAPIGTRGGISVVHNFPADGEYIFRMSFQHESTGNFFGQTSPFDEQIEVSIDGARVALLDVDRWMHRQDPAGLTLVTGRILVPAGPHRVSAAFLTQMEGPVDDLVSPHEWSLADKKIGYTYGVTILSHLRDLTIGGPWNVSGVSETPSRTRVLSCRPDGPDLERPCAESILGRIAAEAYRRPTTSGDMEALMALYEDGAAEGGFEVGVRTGLQGILASPDFIFRIEEPAVTPDGVATYPIHPLDLASRLSFFLWGAPPDDELLQAARDGRLAEDRELEAQVRRMLADPRSEALATRFAAQWLRLQDLDRVHPDALRFPDFHGQLAAAMRRETELFFDDIVRNDRSFFDLLDADYTFVNDRLARHYGMPDVAGPHFRRVSYPDEARRGLLGHASILTQTSHANRTSPVLRGKWVMEVLLGSPPPPPPPDVPDLDATDEAADGRFLSVRERMEMHRASPACRSCHRVIDPLGLALENFDVTGAWRVKENGLAVDPSGELYDGTPLDGPADLREALMKRRVSLVRTFTENMMAYALGRRVEYFDMPTVRVIARDAAAADYRMSAFILGVVRSPAFRMARREAVVEQEMP